MEGFRYPSKGFIILLEGFRYPAISFPFIPIPWGEQVGLGAFLVEQLFFPENERNDQERSHCSKKIFLERLVKERNGTEWELLEKNR